METSQLHDLIERLASVFRGSLREIANAHGLKLVQLEALVYLSRANRYSDTPAALTDYLCITKGSVSQTLKALEARGLLVKRDDPKDKRVVRCALTDAGQSIVDLAHPSPLVTLLSDAQAGAATGAMQALLQALQRANSQRTFGVCHSCRFFETSAGEHTCGLTHEPLTDADSLRICREHEPQAAPAPSRRTGPARSAPAGRSTTSA
ncbi:MAG: MarR family transcriptional regulator [Myxococcota bacterium]